MQSKKCIATAPSTPPLTLPNSLTQQVHVTVIAPICCVRTNELLPDITFISMTSYACHVRVVLADVCVIYFLHVMCVLSFISLLLPPEYIIVHCSGLTCKILHLKANNEAWPFLPLTSMESVLQWRDSEVAETL